MESSIALKARQDRNSSMPSQASGAEDRTALMDRNSVRGVDVQTTFPRLMLQQAESRAKAAALREKEYGIWQTTTWSELSRLVQALACGLHLAGLQRGEHLVLLGSNRPRLQACMLAAQSLGAGSAQL